MSGSMRRVSSIAARWLRSNSIIIAHKKPGFGILRRLNSTSVISQDFIIRSPREDIQIADVPLHEFIWSGMDKWAEKIATECAITGRKYTYKQARTISRKLASALQEKFQLGKGDCFAIISPNVPEYPMLLLAAAEAGLVATTVNPLYTPYEISKQLNDSSAKVIITVPAGYENASKAAELLGKKLPIIVIKDSAGAELPTGGIWFDDVLAASSGQVKSVAFNSQDNVVLPYSSGTTGLPKGVQLTHRNLIVNVAQIDIPSVRLILETTATQQEAVSGLLPMFHIYGMVVVALTTMFSGGKLVTLPRFEPKSYIQSIVDHKIGLLYLVPPLILFLGGHPDVKQEHLSTVRMFNSGAAPIGLNDLLRFQKKAPHVQMFQGYGMTETSPVVMITHKSRVEKYASTGPLLSNTFAKIVDVDSGSALPPGKVGELYIKGPQVMKGYLNRDDENQAILRDGWLRTGDLASYDDDGDFFIVDRLKELIKVKGFQVAPAELEEILRSHPQIADAAVIGVPHDKTGEAPRGFIVPKPGQNLDPDAVASFVAEKVSSHKKITGGIVILPAIPKSAAGKILRKELRLKFGQSAVPTETK